MVENLGEDFSYHANVNADLLRLFANVITVEVPANVPFPFSSRFQRIALQQIVELNDISMWK